MKLTVYIHGTNEAINNALAQLDKLDDIDYGCNPIEEENKMDEQQQRFKMEVEDAKRHLRGAREHKDTFAIIEAKQMLRNLGVNPDE